MKNKIIGFRVDSELNSLLRRVFRRVCEARGEDLSDFIRRAVLKELASLSFLPKEQKKALGLLKEAEE